MINQAKSSEVAKSKSIDNLVHLARKIHQFDPTLASPEVNRKFWQFEGRLEVSDYRYLFCYSFFFCLFKLRGLLSSSLLYHVSVVVFPGLYQVLVDQGKLQRISN